MFTQECFIRKNTPELREKLDSLGHKLNHGKVWGKYLCVFQTEDSDEWRYVATPLSDLNSMPNFDNAIDCGENEELFLAIAALRDDTDKYQCITNGKIFMTCEKDDINEFVAIIYDDYHFKNDEERKDALSNRWHKLTVEELIKHFK